ncbi:MAG: hypothetical protein WCK55_14755 [Verrucomicrobiota bacterium]
MPSAPPRKSTSCTSSVPARLSPTTPPAIFAARTLPTGDNVRERPYTNLYAKLTTKSNTFNVHMRVQVLRKRTGSKVSLAEWNEDLDTVVAEHRGSALIERYADASDPNLPDFATKADATMDNYARFSIVSTIKFAP